MGRTKICPVCGETMYEETKKVHDDRISTGGDYFVGTWKYYCPHCEEVARQKRKEQAQKRYEEKCKKYDYEYQDYLKIREYDDVYNIELTMQEIQALRKLVNTQDRFKDYDIHHAYNVLTSTWVNSNDNTVTLKQHNCIKLIEKNTNHKFYGKTLESARKFISMYIEESQGHSICLNIK